MNMNLLSYYVSTFVLLLKKCSCAWIVALKM